MLGFCPLLFKNNFLSRIVVAMVSGVRLLSRDLGERGQARVQARPGEQAAATEVPTRTQRLEQQLGSGSGDRLELALLASAVECRVCGCGMWPAVAKCAAVWPRPSDGAFHVWDSWVHKEGGALPASCPE